MGRRKSIEKKNPLQIHIYSEGETEKIYFNKMKNFWGTNKRRLKITSVKATGIKLFEHVQKIYKNHNFNTSPINVYLIVDRDDTSVEELQKLWKLCKTENYTLLFSNECFELWMLLHFKNVNNYKSRSQLIKELEKELGKKYSKTDENLCTMLVKNVGDALKRCTFVELSTNSFNINPYTNVGVHITNIFNVSPLKS